MLLEVMKFIFAEIYVVFVNVLRKFQAFRQIVGKLTTVPDFISHRYIQFYKIMQVPCQVLCSFLLHRHPAHPGK